MNEDEPFEYVSLMFVNLFYPYKECFVLLSNQCEIFTRPRTHHPISSSDTICNSSNLPLVDIVCFGSICISVSFMILKPSTIEKV